MPHCKSSTSTIPILSFACKCRQFFLRRPGAERQTERENAREKAERAREAANKRRQ